MNPCYRFIALTLVPLLMLGTHLSLCQTLAAFGMAPHTQAAGASEHSCCGGHDHEVTHQHSHTEHHHHHSHDHSHEDRCDTDPAPSPAPTPCRGDCAKDGDAHFVLSTSPPVPEAPQLECRLPPWSDFVTPNSPNAPLQWLAHTGDPPPELRLDWPAFSGIYLL